VKGQAAHHILERVGAGQRAVLRVPALEQIRALLEKLGAAAVVVHRAGRYALGVGVQRARGGAWFAAVWYSAEAANCELQCCMPLCTAMHTDGRWLATNERTNVPACLQHTLMYYSLVVQRADFPAGTLVVVVAVAASARDIARALYSVVCCTAMMHCAALQRRPHNLCPALPCSAHRRGIGRQRSAQQSSGMRARG
jgi:hypothetical protein